MSVAYILHSRPKVLVRRGYAQAGSVFIRASLFIPHLLILTRLTHSVKATLKAPWAGEDEKFPAG